jgi:hypothetical protein
VKSVEEIVEVTGGWERLRRRPLKIEVEGNMPLHVEIIGRGPRGATLLSIMHTYVQNGDVMRDPDVEVEVVPGSDEEWLPVSFRQDGLGIFQQAVSTEGGVVLFHHGLVADLKRFLKMWDRNIREQGFVEAARRLPGN